MKKMADREKVIERLENLAKHAVHYVGEPPFVMSLDDGIALHDAIDLLKEQEPRVLEYSEIENHPLVWLEDNDKEDVIPALFLQYNGWCAEFLRQATDKYVDTIVRSAKVIADERMYGITWRAWTSRPSPEQMRNTLWEGAKDE